jgi:hypothetical protein
VFDQVNRLNEDVTNKKRWRRWASAFSKAVTPERKHQNARQCQRRSFDIQATVTELEDIYGSSSPRVGTRVRYAV